MVRFSVQARYIPLFEIPDRLLGPTNLMSSAYVGFFAGDETNIPDRFLSIARLKNTWIYTSTYLCAFVAYAGTTVQWLRSSQCWSEYNNNNNNNNNNKSFNGWTLWFVPSPEPQLLAPTLLRSSNCSPSLWSVVVWFQRDSVLWQSLQA